MIQLKVHIPSLSPNSPAGTGVDSINGDDGDGGLCLPEKVHDIVKSREHGGECRKCGLKGTWDFIKSSPCQATKANSSISPPKTNASEVKVTSSPAASLGDQLDLALKNEDEQTAWEIVEKMEADQAAQSLQDQQLMVELMEQELEMLDAMEQLEQLENLEKEEKELEQALLLSKQPLEKLDQVDYSLCTARPPASPCTSLSKPPVIVVAQPPAQCYSAPMHFQIHM